MMSPMEVEFRVRLYAVPSAFGWLVVAAIRMADTDDWSESTYGPYPTDAAALAAIERAKASFAAGIPPSFN